MLYEIFLGLAFGFSVCLPLGPINILIINLSTHSPKSALAVGLGAACCDTALMLGFGFFSANVGGAFVDVLSICGAAIITYMALGLLRTKARKIEPNSAQPERKELGKYFVKGFFINALNPYVVMFWLGIAPQFVASAHPAIYAFSVCLACFIWVFALAFFIARFAHLLSVKILRAINVTSSIILLFFAAKMLFASSLAQYFWS